MIYDRWHLSQPPEGADPCRCGRGRNKLYPTKIHGRGRRWQVRWDVIGEDGKRRQPRKNFHERYGDDPERHAEAFDHKVGTEPYVDPAAGKITLEEYAKQWRSGLMIDPASLVVIDNRLAHIYDVPAGPRSRRRQGTSSIGKLPMTLLAKRPSLIQQWIKSLERKKLSPQYINHIVGTLSSIFIAAIDDGIVQRNPTRARSVSPPKVVAAEIEPWTAGQIRAAREALVGNEAMVDLGAGAGLRESEVFGLAVEDIEFLGKDRKIKVRRQVKRIVDEDRKAHLVFALPKHDKIRTVSLPDSLATRLAERIRTRPPVEITLAWETPDGPPVTVHLLFVRPRGQPWHESVFSRPWSKARQAAGAPATRQNGFHICRHTYASEQLAAGVDIRTLAAELGHTDPAFTVRKYTHFIPRTAAKVRKAVDDFFASDGRSALDVPSQGRD